MVIFKNPPPKGSASPILIINGSEINLKLKNHQINRPANVPPVAQAAPYIPQNIRKD
jgi:hypothetical protein